MSKFKKGDRVFWTDPDEGLCSGKGTVTSIKPHGIFVQKDDGGELEARPRELKKLKKFRVDLSTLAMMRGSLAVEAVSAAAAEEDALNRTGDVSWSYEETCEGENGPAVQDSMEIT